MSIDRDVAKPNSEENHADGSGLPSAKGGWRVKQRKDPVEKSIQRTRVSPLNNHHVAPPADKTEEPKRRSSPGQRRPFSPRLKWARAVALRRKPLAMLSSVAVVVMAFLGFSELGQNSNSQDRPTEITQVGAMSHDATPQTGSEASDRQIRAIALPALEDEGFLPIYFRLTEPADRPVDITYETIAHTASAETDFAAKNGTVTIHPGDVSVELTIQLVDDDDIESIEMFRVRLSTDTSSARLTDEELMATVLDDDRAESTRAN